MNSNSDIYMLLKQLCIYKINNGLRAGDLIERFDVQKKGFLMEGEFLSMFLQIYPQNEQLIIKLFKYLVDRFGKINELCIKTIAAQMQKDIQSTSQQAQQNNVQQKNYANPHLIFQLIQKLLRHRNITIKEQFKKFDYDDDDVIDQRGIKQFLNSIIQDIKDFEIQAVIDYFHQDKTVLFSVTLFQLMKAIQQEESMKQSLKLNKKISANYKDKEQQQQQGMIQQQTPIQTNREFIMNQNTADSMKQAVYNKYNASKPVLVDQPIKQRVINPILESNIYEDPSYAHILKSDIKFQNYVIMDRDLPGIKEFLRLFNEYQSQNKIYTDDQFKAGNNSLGPKLINNQYQWKRPQEFWNGKCSIFCKDDSEQGRYGLGKWISDSDILQGELGDCYLLSSVSSIACRWPEQILSLFVTPKINPSGIYCLRLCVDGEWRCITVDDQFPTKYNNPVFSKSLSNELWVMLIEKVWAKIYGSYSNIISGTPREVIRSLTGCPTLTIFTEKPEFDEQLTNYIKKKSILTSGSLAEGPDGISKLQAEKLGLVPGHAYSLLKLRNITHPKFGQVKLLKLRNPWGKLEWKGAWSDGSLNWTTELREQLKMNRKDDGRFYMDLLDFKKYFAHVDVGVFKTDNKHKSWNFVSKRNNALYFSFQIKLEGEYYISVIQSSERLNRQKYKNYQYSPAKILIGQLQNQKNQEFCYKYAIFQQEQETSIGGYFGVGNYVMYAKVEWLFWEEHDFILSAYGESEVKLKQISKIPNFVQMCYQDRARKIETLKPYANGIGRCLELYLDQGFGLIYFKNSKTSGKNIEIDYQITQREGIKLRKPQRGSSFKINLIQDQEMCVVMKLSIKGCKFASSESFRIINIK